MAKETKTNAMRMLERQKVPYQAFTYECDDFIDGIHCADMIQAPQIFVRSIWIPRLLATSRESRRPNATPSSTA